MKSKLDLEGMDLPQAIRKGWRRPCKWHGLTLYPMQKGCYLATDESLEALGLYGLRIFLTWGIDAKIYISNSPHKVMHGGSNTGDFYLSQMIEYISLVGERLGIPYWKAKPFGRMEIAVNLIQDHPDQFIAEIDSHKLREMEPMKEKDKIYGKRSTIQAMQLKIYNPHLKLKFSEGRMPKFKNALIRCEIATKVSYLNRKKNFRINTMMDLTKPEIYTELGKMLTNSTNSISFEGVLPIATPINYAAHSLFRHGSKELLARFKASNKKTYERYRARFSKLEKGKSTRHNDLPQRVRDKWQDLSGS